MGARRPVLNFVELGKDSWEAKGRLD